MDMILFKAAANRSETFADWAHPELFYIDEAWSAIENDNLDFEQTSKEISKAKEHAQKIVSLYKKYMTKVNKAIEDVLGLDYDSKVKDVNSPEEMFKNCMATLFTHVQEDSDFWLTIEQALSEDREKSEEQTMIDLYTYTHIINEAAEKMVVACNTIIDFLSD